MARQLMRVQVSLQDRDVLPRDEYVSSFWLTQVDAASVIDFNGVKDALTAFYTGTVTGVGMHNWLSPCLSLGSSTIKMYDMSQPKESPPIDSVFMTLTPAAGVGVGLPNEVACCLTLHAIPQPGVPRQSWRGRIYLGPLNTNCLDGDSGSTSEGVNVQHSRPKATFIQAVRAGGESLHGALLAANASWVIYSRTRQTMYPVKDISIDDAWDTQRRRGLRPTIAVHNTNPLSGPNAAIPFSVAR